MEPVRPAAARIRDWLGLPPSRQLSWPKRRYSVAFANWRKVLIDKRIQVFVQALGREGIRGFSAFDDYAPLMVVNSAEIHAARNFTLFHELAHLMTRTDSACGSVSVASGKGPQLERWCEEIAAAVLMPEAAFAKVVGNIRNSPNPPQDEFALAVRIAGYFNVSIRSAGIQLSSMGLASRSLYAEIEAKAIPLDRKKAGGGSGAGERAPERRLRELGEGVTGRLLEAQASNWVTERDLRSILRLDGSEIEMLRGVV
jgi:Zn-dependent peptidase ImmA (M78 family)